MAKAKYYTVIAGNHIPQKQLLGFLNKDTGQPKPDYKEIEMVVGMMQVPNYSSVWGRRVAVDETGKDLPGSCSLTDKNYKGKVEDLVWGAVGGEAIEIRYLTNSRSIDKQYQDTVQKLKMKDEDAFVDLKPGLNDFDETVVPALVQFLKIHGRNGSSVSRNPDIRESDFKDYDAKRIIGNDLDKIRVQQTALNLVFSTEGNDEKIGILAEILGFDSQQQSATLFDDLVSTARAEGDKGYAWLVAKFDKFKKETLKMMQETVEFKALDITQDGMMSLYENSKKDVILDKIPAEYKGVKMFMYVTDFIFDTKVYRAVKRISVQHQILKKKV